MGEPLIEIRRQALTLHDRLKVPCKVELKVRQ